MGRIAETFAKLKKQGRKALVPFVTAGDPDMATTETLLHSLVENGADVIELGIPFSDPMADGPTIQAASERALAGGVTLGAILQLVSRVRQHTNTPIVLMGYYNPVLRYGIDAFAADAAAAGVDGLLLVDLPPEEAGEIHGALRRRQINLITLLAPTSPPERRRQLAAAGEGYLYYVSMTGVTGTQHVDPQAIAADVAALRRESRVPVAVGFGITSPSDAEAVAAFADAVVVGSALVKIIAEYGKSPELPERVAEFIAALRQGVDRAT
ncbi:tryptophan synthase subunit alpha [Geothermobacter hydrogeniphilus]|uniref:Tryptophan synthase alpha chain n=1 Tax=Geothermobacter hydrogeniphilus TaxID=1969733 RepID=A0A2K2HEC5_9BACT|nr:tryptophan synthase subunit alpha [Geothermobacter hydrogeniphilus]PNU21581.1 tryptophan synthase subunit alpha [Geothermobacter hydrogeniphilus]